MAKPLLLIPVENQVREMEAKLLIATLAAQKGYRSIIGWRGLLDQRIGRYPPSIYFAKSFAPANTKMLRIKRKLGHFVIAWDEEAVVHYPPEIYYRRRIGDEALDLIDRFIAWGQDNDELMRGHPRFRPEISRILGNPRADLLRKELRTFSQKPADALRSEHGDFILINTNFGSINGYAEELNLMRKDATGEWVQGRGSQKMPRDYAEGLFNFRSRVLEGFRTLIPALAQTYPDRKIILRPHPSENHDDWKERLKDHDNIEVIAKGNVVPWLMACSALVHNGCTTAVEGFLLGTRIVSYVPEDDDRYEFALPNALGRRSPNLAEVIKGIEGEPESDETLRQRRATAERFIASLDGELASERIVAMLDEFQPHPISFTKRMGGILHAEGRALVKQSKAALGSKRYDASFRQQRFPSIKVDAVQAIVDRLSGALNLSAPKTSPHAPDLFEINPI